MVELVATALPVVVVAVARVVFEMVSVKVTVSPSGGAGVIVVVKLTVAPTGAGFAGVIAKVVVVAVFEVLGQPVTRAWASTDPKPVTGS
jgi:hypothetical protein